MADALHQCDADSHHTPAALLLAGSHSKDTDRLGGNLAHFRTSLPSLAQARHRPDQWQQRLQGKGLCSASAWAFTRSLARRRPRTVKHDFWPDVFTSCRCSSRKGDYIVRDWRQRCRFGSSKPQDEHCAVMKKSVVERAGACDSREVVCRHAVRLR